MRKLYFLFIGIFILVSTNSFSRNNIRPTGGKAAGMGNAFVSQYDVFSTYHNQAGLSKIDRTSIAIFYTNRFFIPEMNNRAVLVAFPTGVGNWAVNYNAFGPSKAAETNIGLSYGRFLTEKLSAGIHFNYFGTRLPEDNKTAATIGFELGAIYQLTEKTFLGAHIANPFTPPIKTQIYTEAIPWQIAIGGHTKYSDEFTFSYELETNPQEIPIIQLGIDWEVANNFFIRGGFNTGPARFSAGFGYISDYLVIDTAFEYHQYAGYTPSVSLILSFF